MSQLTNRGSGEKRSRPTVYDYDDTEETVEQKKARLASAYLSNVNVSIDGDSDDLEDTLVEGSDDYEDEDDEDPYAGDKVAEYLRQQALKDAGREERSSVVARMKITPQRTKDITSNILHIQPRITKSHRGTKILSLALSEDNTFAVTGDLRGYIYQEHLETGQHTTISIGTAKGQHGHKNGVCDLSISSDNVYLASAGEDGTVRIWDLRAGRDKEREVHKFTRHTSAVRAVAFKRDSLDLFSGGLDKVVNVYDIEKMNFVETLYGHAEPINALDILYMNRLFSCSEDSSARIWKMDVESQAVFQLPRERLSIDTISAIDHNFMVTGTESGHLDYWYALKKKPVYTISKAHGGNWISSVDALYARDIVASGSNDGYLRLWQAKIDENVIAPLAQIPVRGWINRIAIGNDARFILAAVGEYHRLGKWFTQMDDKPGLHVYQLDQLFSDQ